MRRHAARAGGLVLGLVLLCAGGPAHAVIMKLTPLGDVLRDHPLIFTAKVEKIDPDKPGALLAVDEELKGKAPFTRLIIDLKGDSEAAKDDQSQKLLKRIAPKTTLVLFASARGKNYVLFAYTNGTWFQVTGQKGDGERLPCGFTHCEPYFRRTFKDGTDELRQVVVDGLAGKKSPPEPNPKEEPGLGPELKAEEPKPEEKKPEEVGLAGGPLLAVIPTVLIGGPLAILAMLFPAIFGGVTGQLKRWLAALTVISLNSMVLVAHDWLRPVLRDTWWGGSAAPWLVMTVLTLAGLLWAWRRHLTRVSLQAESAEAPESRGRALLPSRGEHVALWVLSLIGVGLVAFAWWSGSSLFAAPWNVILVLWSGVWVSTLHVFVARLGANRPRPRPVLSTEGVMLWAMALAGTGFLAALLPGGAAAGAQAGGVARLWRFEAKEPGVVYSSPAVAGDRVYVAAAHQSGFLTYGKLYCLDRATGKELWAFDNEEDMKQVFSTPCVAGDRVYVGEGFHQDKECRLYCLDAATGKKVWEFPTSSHTESSPCVVDGKVYFGAGDDGVFCVDAATGKEVWHFQGLHVDCNPAVAGGRLYAGSGVGDVYRDTFMFCLDAATGKEQWRWPADLPVWGSPALRDGHAYFGLGNGNFLQSADKPAGAVLCVEMQTGRPVWRYDVADGVLDRPAVNQGGVFFGSRDRHVYCLDRQAGTPRWKRDLGSPAVAAVTLAQSPGGGASARVYAVASTGRFVCLDADNGNVAWELDMIEQAQAQPELFSTPAVSVSDGGERRSIVFGAGLYNFTSRAAAVFCYEERTASE